MPDAGAPAGLLIELRQKTVQLLEAIDSGLPDEDAWQYTKERPHPNDPMLGRADSARGEDHEAGIEAAAEETALAFGSNWPVDHTATEWDTGGTVTSEEIADLYRGHARAIVGAYLAARPSPVDDTERLREAAAEMLACFDAKFPKGQSKVVPGVTWHCAAERLRDALAALSVDAGKPNDA